MSKDEYKKYAVIADGKSLAFVDLKETPEYLIAKGGARYKKAEGMGSLANNALGIVATQKIKIGMHTSHINVYEVYHPTVTKLHDTQRKAQFKETIFRSLQAKFSKLTYPDAVFLNTAFSLDVAEPELHENKPKTSYSTCDENWEYHPSLRDVLKQLHDNDQLVAGRVVWSGTLVPENPIDYAPKAKGIVEDYGNNLVDNFGESADGHDGIAELKQHSYSELEALVFAWFSKNIKPSCGVIENKEEIVITDDMVDYFLGSYRGGKAR